MSVRGLGGICSAKIYALLAGASRGRGQYNGASGYHPGEEPDWSGRQLALFAAPWIILLAGYLH